MNPALITAYAERNRLAHSLREIGNIADGPTMSYSPEIERQELLKRLIVITNVVQGALRVPTHDNGHKECDCKDVSSFGAGIKPAALLIVAVVLGIVLFFGIAAHCQTQTIDHGRVQTIQRALRRNGYALPVTGVLDGKTTAALQDIAQTHGWQHKQVPDSRVLIYLGLGPNYSGLLNPETAMIARNQ